MSFLSSQCSKTFWKENDNFSLTEAKTIIEHNLLITSVFLKNGPIPASFCLFLLFSQYNFNNTN